MMSSQFLCFVHLATLSLISSTSSDISFTPNPEHGYNVTVKGPGKLGWSDQTALWLAIEFAALHRVVYVESYYQDGSHHFRVRGYDGRSIRVPYPESEPFPEVFLTAGGSICFAMHRGAITGVHIGNEERARNHRITAFNVVTGKVLYVSDAHKLGIVHWTNGKIFISDKADYPLARRTKSKFVQQYLDVRSVRTRKLLHRYKLPGYPLHVGIVQSSSRHLTIQCRHLLRERRVPDVNVLPGTDDVPGHDFTLNLREFEAGYPNTRLVDDSQK